MCFPSFDPETEKAKTYVFIIQILVVAQIILSILIVISHDSFIPHGILGFFLAFALFVAQKLVSHNLLLFQIFLGLYFALIFLFACINFAQNDVDPADL